MNLRPLSFVFVALVTLGVTAGFTECGGTVTVASSESTGSSSQGGPSGVASIAESALDFGLSPCGGAAVESKTVTVKNDGAGPLRWSLSLDSSEHFAIEGETSGTLSPGALATVTVAPLPTPSGAIAGVVYKTNLVVTTDDEAHPEFSVPLTLTAEGGNLELIAPSVADFGQLPVGEAAPPIPVTLKNTGNAPIKVSVSAPLDAQFGFTWAGGPTAAEVAPGESMSGLVATFTPYNAKPTSSAGLVTTEGAVCGVSASAIVVKGSGLGGVAGTSPGAVDFGKVGCDTQAEPRVLTVYNSGNLVFTWTASLMDGSNYTLSQSGGAVVPGGASFLTVTPKKLGMTTELGDNAFGDTLTITTDVPGDLPHVVPIKQTATGAILNWNATALDFGSVPAFTKSAPKVIVVTNSGTQAAKVKVVGGTTFESAEGVVAGSGGVFVAAVTFTPDDLGVQKGTFGLVTDDPVCAELPAGVNATGSGTGKAAALSLGGSPRNRGSSQGGCALLANSGGKIACFGSNDFGQLGPGASGSGPRIIPNVDEVVSVASGDDFHCAALKDGRVLCWGNNRARNNQRTGKLGATGIDTSVNAVEVSGITDAVEVSAGHNLACARLATGSVTCWGTNRRGNLGTGSSGGINNAPQQVNGVQNAVQIAVGGGGACARLNDNTVRCWGQYARGNLGSCCGPGALQVQNMTDAAGLAAMTGGGRSGPRCALRMNGQIACWGDPAHGQLGTGSSFRGEVQNPSTVNLPMGATAVAGYINGGCALLMDKTVRCWGRGDFGQLGNGTNNETSISVQVSGITDAETVAAGGRGVCAIVAGGSVKCWGNYGAGSSNTPQALKYF